MSPIPEFAWLQVESALRDLADGEHQLQTWIHRQTSDPRSPSELVCQLFDDTGLEHSLERRRGTPVFSAEADELLLELSRLVDRLDDLAELSPSELLADARWRAIQALAASAAELLATLRRATEGRSTAEE